MQTENEARIIPASSLTGGAAEAAISEYEFRLLRDYIHDRCGIFFDDSKASSLAAKLSFRMKLLDIPSHGEYYNYLKFNPRSRREFEDLIPHLTNNETYFFREVSQLNFLVSRLAEKAANGKDIRVLSCGCSSGEEAFTLAILLEEAGLYRPGRRVELVGIDIDRKVIEKASKAEYTSYSLRAADKSSIERYFRTEGDKYSLKEGVREKVGFRLGNLFDRETLAGCGPVDAILCRNVFIYFSDDAIRKIVEGFHETLSGDGWLLLGHSESLSRITDIFYPKRHPSIIVYSKKDR